MSPRSFAITLLSAPLLALAQNAFKIPEAGLSATGGQPVDLQWDPTTDGTVTLVLRSGSSNNLNEGTVIANSIENDGSYTWTPSNDLTRGSDYTVQIVSDEDPSVVNYTPYFVLDTDTTVAKSTSEVSLGATSAAPDLSTASPTGSATSVLDSTATSDSESTSATTTDDSSSQTTSMPSSGTSSGNMMMTSSGMTMMTGTSSMTTGTSTNSDASTTATSSDASSTESSSAAASTSVANLNDENGAGALKISGAALAGLVAAVALGAFAL
ncbi:hypothetical protein KC332_g1135 [Hortaea werneckii]|uniref:Yeast cell wall synthesis Kre9/Knh1-like N-terminal domain-containing protein n=2 Tax=Hortaea werneckii TaxID=91943 RepID=A0A3M7I7F9_HORWE|nr:hypothetical protein KC358_g4289 [Hortaea werneckii]OTA19081.1 hypothetical protein BTJ68_15574 [Hortaea werneckii EXF-2000]KAI6846122.1 hypothetical protein KC350_g4069 [Hortaea werneckii]KAI6930102.1 hypothetical protein KC341_g10449 [Hortaea werneckii]KAI6949776.1 hypothetical protein KC348_g1099 [Hortaea werneckii]